MAIASCGSLRVGAPLGPVKPVLWGPSVEASIRQDLLVVVIGNEEGQGILHKKDPLLRVFSLMPKTSGTFESDRQKY